MKIDDKIQTVLEKTSDGRPFDFLSSCPNWFNTEDNTENDLKNRILLKGMWKTHGLIDPSDETDENTKFFISFKGLTIAESRFGWKWYKLKNSLKEVLKKSLTGVNFILGVVNVVALIYSIVQTDKISETKASLKTKLEAVELFYQLKVDFSHYKEENELKLLRIQKSYDSLKNSLNVNKKK